MKTTLKRTYLGLLFIFFSTVSFAQSYNVAFVDDTTIWTSNCDSVATLDFYVNLWGPGQNVDNLYYIGANGINPNDQVLVTVDWGDGSTNTYMGIYVSPTSPIIPTGTVEHVYPSGVTSNYPITVTVTNPINGSSATNSNFVFNAGCASYFYGYVNVDCDSNGVIDTSYYWGVDMIATGLNGSTYPFTTNSSQTMVNLPADTYTLAIDPAWLAANNYLVLDLFPSSFTVQNGNPGQITFQATLICDSIPPVVDGCVFGQVFCDDNNNGIFDPGETGIYNAPVSINYNGQTLLTYTDPNGYYSIFAPNGNQAGAVVTVDANWLGQNGYQLLASNVYTVIIEPCQSSNPSTANFPVDCSYAQPPMECIYGWVFCDANGNGVLDSGEVLLPNAPVEVSGNTGYTTTIYSDSNGVISYSSQAFFGGYAILTVPQWWLTQHGYAMNNNVFTVQTDCNNPTPAYLAVNCSPVLCADLWTTVSPWIGYYQNQNNYIKLKWGNYGPNATTGYTLTLTFPSSVTPNTASIANSNYVISGNTITWTFGPGSSYIYQTDVISFFVPSGYPSGTSHTYSATIVPLGSTADCDLLNNDGSLCMILGNSYDPNDKSTSHAPIIDPTVQDELTYVIRFQNTGTAPAQDVYIIDSLSSNLDWSTLQVVSTSHNMQLVDLGNGVMKFNFPGIWLPDSTSNEPASHGDVVFRIKENAGNGIGTSIENTGYIYFDWNPAIITNTVVNTNDVLGLEDATINEVRISPNPSNGSLKVVSAEFMDGISIFDLAGKVVFETDASGFQTQLELSHLRSGVYLIKVISGAEVTTERMIMK